MKLKNICSMGLIAMLLMGATSCLDTHVSDDHDAFANIDADADALAGRLAPKFYYENGTNHSNKVRVYNNSGYDCRLDYIVGTVMLGHGTDNCAEVVVPFSGDLVFTATVLCEGALVPVEIPVRVEDLDSDLDPLFVALSGGSSEGRTWQWWADEENGSYSYIDGSWGCVGGGGYGWSPTGPNWVCYGIGMADEWTGQLITMDEWVKFDLDGGPNVTVHYSDGTEAKGTFALTSGTTPEKAALGWVATMKLTVPLPHQITDGQYSWYLDLPAEFDVAMLDDEHLILIAPGGGGAHVICDDSWGISSTHWTFKVKK
ncbi:MAG: hypothetical protein K2J42_02935 [Muribaculaceae bacterium]|nr:hypothetical protein [Muribaculaceae bacterium]MDE6809028.1 hypothetical protein [Muribaculaceae bacterium]